MKCRLLIIILMFSLPLSGCKSLYNNYKEIEQLLVIRTMGLDTSDSGVQLSLASSLGGGGQAPRLLSAQGSSITTAMERAYSYSYEESLFLSHVDQILIGEDAASDGIGDYLSYISRTPEMRLDMPIFIVREGRAEDAVMKLSDGQRGVTETLESVEISAQHRGDSGIYTAADVMADLLSNGSALVCAIELAESSESTDSGDSAEDKSPKLTAAANGFAVLRYGKLCRYLTKEQAIAVGLLKNEGGISELEVMDKYGTLTVLEVDSGSSRIKPRWAGPEELVGLEIELDIKASVIETDDQSRLHDADYIDHLTAGLEELISNYVTETLQVSRELKADFLGIGQRIERQNAQHYAKLSRDIGEMLPQLELVISVSARLSHTNDMKDS